jgi:AraC-like DNA-binding protein
MDASNQCPEAQRPALPKASASLSAYIRATRSEPAGKPYTSYVRKLFESEGSSFSECVLGERLIRAHRMLTDPRFADRSIASAAFDAGFGDVSYFNRSFRRRFGATPSEIRAEAKYRQAK